MGVETVSLNNVHDYDTHQNVKYEYSYNLLITE